MSEDNKLGYAVRFPLGSGINGNQSFPRSLGILTCLYASLWEAELMETLNKALVKFVFREYASLWEAELMETLNSAEGLRPLKSVRFPLGSGINGNKTRLMVPSPPAFWYASLWEAELMETL